MVSYSHYCYCTGKIKIQDILACGFLDDLLEVSGIKILLIILHFVHTVLLRPRCVCEVTNQHNSRNITTQS